MTAPHQTLFLVDAHGYLHRAYHALPPLTNSRGEPVGALFGFAKMLTKIIRQNAPDRLVVCFDDSAPTFRHQQFPQYKAHRKEVEPSLKFQLPLARRMVEAWGLASAVAPGYEADDLLATLADRGVSAGFSVVVVTSDKDALQLVGGPVKVLNESKGILYDAVAVKTKFRLRPDQMVDYLALLGDASDNVPGVPGVGEKTAASLLERFDTLDGIYRRLDEIKGSLKEKLAAHETQARQSRALVELNRQAPLAIDVDDCRVPGQPSADLLAFISRYEFNSLLTDLRSVAPSRVSPPLLSPISTGEAPTPIAVKVSARVVHRVLSESSLAEAAKTLSGVSEFAVDVETTGLEDDSRLVGISLAVKEGEAWYIPIGHVRSDIPQLSVDRVRAVLGPLLADPAIGKIGHNLKFDAQVLDRHGMPLSPITFDTLVASYCLNPGRNTHGLKALALELLGEDMTPLETLIGKGAQQITMAEVAVDVAADYAGADAEVSWRLKTWMEPRLREMGMDPLFREVEMPLVPILSAMETRGIGLDVPYLRGLQEKFAGDIARLEADIHAEAGEAVNIHSPKQLSALLFGKLGLPVIRKTKTGYSTDEEVLSKLSALHPLPAKIVAYREKAKLKSTYVDGLLEKVRSDGRVHTRFNQAVAATGRLSSSDPNLQNIPIRTEEGRQIRRAFVAEKGSVFLSADYSQIDLRVLAHVSGDAALVAAFRGGDDIHAATARDLFHLPPGAPVSDEQRRTAKTVNFGIVYGQTGFGLAQQLGIPLGQAQQYIRAYLEKYAGVKTWMAAIIEEARRKGYVTTLLQRRRYLPDMGSSNPTVRGFAERTAMNTPIQGTSADIIKAAMVRLARRLGCKGEGCHLLLQVHDDLLWEVSSSEVEELARVVRHEMESALVLDVPLRVDLKTGPNWADMKPYA